VFFQKSLWHDAFGGGAGAKGGWAGAVSGLGGSVKA